jgi:hypothetical protein
MSSIIIQLEQMITIWETTGDIRKVSEYIEDLPADTRRALLTYVERATKALTAYNNYVEEDNGSINR